MVLIYYNNKQRYRLTIRIDALDYSDLFLIIRLYSFSFLIPVIRYYNKGRYDLVYKKVYLVEVLDVGFYNIIFDNYILKKPKPNFNYLWVFILDSLIIVQTILIYTELWLSFDEVENFILSYINYIIKLDSFVYFYTTFFATFGKKNI